MASAREEYEPIHRRSLVCATAVLFVLITKPRRLVICAVSVFGLSLFFF